MLMPYFVRILCVALASFFLIHMLAGVAVWLVAPVAIRSAHRMRPSLAAHLLLMLRLLPCGVAILIVAALCMPSYLQLEPEAPAEHVRLSFIAASVLGVFLWSASFTRGLRSWMRSRRFIANCRRNGRCTPLATGFSQTWTIAGSTPFLALAGIFRPHLIVSRGMLAALSPDELRAALRHERAHWISRDQLKRLVMLLAPDIFPFFGGFRDLERAWAKFTEWAADDMAAAGSPRDSVTLASALVRVARLGSPPAACDLVTTLAPDRGDLPARVNRLLSDPPPDAGQVPLVIGTGVAVLVTLFVGAMLQPATLAGAYRLMEDLINPR